MERRKGTVQEVTETELRNKLKTAQADPDDERRTDRRHPARWEIEVPLVNVEQLRRVYTTNISKGGLLFTLASPATLPATIELVMTLPDGKKVHIQSEVRHVARREGSTDFDVGVQFQPLAADARKTFEAVLQRLTQPS